MEVDRAQDSPQKRAQTLLDVLENAANSNYIGEPISQLEHALQAAHLGRLAGATDAAVLAALFHDVGHLIDTTAPQMDGLGTINHEQLGAIWLSRHGVSPAVTRLVEAHVDAKRYLCARYPDYYQRLSSASKGTLAYQGGPMSEIERLSFETREDFREILALRSWDERAKIPNADVPDLQDYFEMLVSNLNVGESSA